jgi:hypothetical protein
VQFLHPARPSCLQASAQQVGEQAVVAPPAAHLIQRHQEQACPLCLSQHRLAAGPAAVLHQALTAGTSRGFLVATGTALPAPLVMVALIGVRRDDPTGAQARSAAVVITDQTKNNPAPN